MKRRGLTRSPTKSGIVKMTRTVMRRTVKRRGNSSEASSTLPEAFSQESKEGGAFDAGRPGGRATVHRATDLRLLWMRKLRVEIDNKIDEPGWAVRG